LPVLTPNMVLITATIHPKMCWTWLPSFTMSDALARPMRVTIVSSQNFSVLYAGIVVSILLMNRIYQRKEPSDFSLSEALPPRPLDVGSAVLAVLYLTPPDRSATGFAPHGCWCGRSIVVASEHDHERHRDDAEDRDRVPDEFEDDHGISSQSAAISQSVQHDSQDRKRAAVIIRSAVFTTHSGERPHRRRTPHARRS